MDYKDVMLNLSDDSYKSFRKLSNEISYIHKESNHPPSTVESRSHKFSSDKNVFIQAARFHQEVLKRAGYNHRLSYNNSDKYNNNNNNDKNSCYNNDTKNDNNYNNNEFKFNNNDNLDNSDNNSNKDNLNNYDSNDNNSNNQIKYNSNE